jgi:hydroxyacylglutathione hydrolase
MRRLIVYICRMLQLNSFTFNPFYENTYVLSDESKACVIIDPGCFDADEEAELRSFIEDNGLRPLRLLNTHCHIDHVLGNKFVSDTWKIGLEIPVNEAIVLNSYAQTCHLYGIPGNEQPEVSRHIQDAETIRFGTSELNVISAPGHSPGHVCFYHAPSKLLIGGDVLFRGSVGRTDLPGGSSAQLLKSIRETLFALPDDTVVYPGHGPSTTIGIEKMSNPFAGLQLMD